MDDLYSVLTLVIKLVKKANIEFASVAILTYVMVKGYPVYLLFLLHYRTFLLPPSSSRGAVFCHLKRELIKSLYGNFETRSVQARAEFRNEPCINSDV